MTASFALIEKYDGINLVEKWLCHCLILSVLNHPAAFEVSVTAETLSSKIADCCFLLWLLAIGSVSVDNGVLKPTDNSGKLDSVRVT